MDTRYLEHPDITSARAFGTLVSGDDSEDDMTYLCPKCKEELGYRYTVYADEEDKIIGCEYCVYAKKAFDVRDLL